MTTGPPLKVPMQGDAEFSDAAVQRDWRSAVKLSSAVSYAEEFLSKAGFDRGPWLVVAFAAGIASWFVLKSPWQWSAAIGLALLGVIGAIAAWQGEGTRSRVRSAITALGLMFAMGVAVIWLRSNVVGAEPIDRPMVLPIQAYVLEREDQPALDRVRLTLAMRDAAAGRAIKIRVNVPVEQVRPRIVEGATIRMRARLMPPAAPMLPGSYDFARTAWFKGLSATGSALDGIEVIRPAERTTVFAPIQRSLSAHVHRHLDGSAGSIAAAFASGDRGAISEADEDAMRDAGLTHLLSISGLHVSAVIAAAYLLSLKLLAMWPAIALRIRLPVVAAAAGALAGIGYTLLTGAEVPTVRSCVAALLVLVALALGRDALSLRMVAVAAFVVLLLWPEAISGPSFQMSFAAVLAIIALHNAAPVRAFLAPREESAFTWAARRGAMLLLTGLVIEVALTPIVLFHFHRAGLYGALANVFAIPLVTFVAMPLIALALALDLLGIGAPVWWLAGKSLDLLVGIAHFTASQPGAVKLMPQMDALTFTLFIVGLLWLALWRGRQRLVGFVPIGLASAMLLLTPVPDILISGDGQQVGVTVGGERLLSLRESRSDYARDNLLELSGIEAAPMPIEDWPGADCSSEFCVLTIARGGRDWHLLMARNRVRVEERALAAACERSDIVIADRWLPASCHPSWLKADRNLLERTGGLALLLSGPEPHFQAVSDSQGEHGWWRGRRD